jgi:hypothetical protein
MLNIYMLRNRHSQKGGTQPNLKWYNNRCFGDVVLQSLYTAENIREWIIDPDVDKIWVSDEEIAQRNIDEGRGTPDRPLIVRPAGSQSNKHLSKLRNDLIAMKAIDIATGVQLPTKQLDNAFEQCKAIWKLTRHPVNSFESAGDLLTTILSVGKVPTPLYTVDDILLSRTQVPPKNQRLLNTVYDDKGNILYYLQGCLNKNYLFVKYAKLSDDGQRALPIKIGQFLHDAIYAGCFEFKLLSFYTLARQHYIYYLNKDQTWYKYDDRVAPIDRINISSVSRIDDCIELTLCYENIGSTIPPYKSRSEYENIFASAM